MNVTELPKLYTDAEAAQILRCSRAVLRKLRNQGKIRFTMVAKKAHYTANDIREFLGMPEIEQQVCSEQPEPTAHPSFPNIQILPVPVLRALMDPMVVTGSGVYFLWLADDLIYIGQSECVAGRVSHHRQACQNVFSRSFYFDVATAMPVEWPYHLAVEAAYIRAYPTKGNRKA